MKWLNSWTRGIIIAVILATIIEMIIPEGKNKKYIKTIIGMFILFSIISPVISKFSNESISFNENLFDNYNNTYQSYNSIDQNREIIEVYKNNLAKEITVVLNEMGFDVTKIELNISSMESNFGDINTIKLEIEKKKELGNVESVNKIEVNIGENKERIENSENVEQVKEYLSETYRIDKQKILIN